MELVIAAWLLAAAAFDDAPAKPPKSDICHVPPGNPANAHTLSLPESAFAAHLGHGDTAGACAAEGPAGGKADKADAKGKKGKSPVCHAGDDGSPRTLYLPAPAVRAHLGHGDAAGPCAGGAPGEGAR